MIVVYFAAVMGILLMNAGDVPGNIALIFTDAFAANHIDKDAAFGGALGALIVLGARRAAFSNEAGLGTAPMAHGAAKTSEPVHEGLVAMLGPVIDTLVVCTLTALAIFDHWGVGNLRGNERSGAHACKLSKSPMAQPAAMCCSPAFLPLAFRRYFLILISAINAFRSLLDQTGPGFILYFMSPVSSSVRSAQLQW